jgi:hypothetical protein
LFFIWKYAKSLFDVFVELQAEWPERPSFCSMGDHLLSSVFQKFSSSPKFWSGW